jgi:hypothetical protein
MAYDALATVRRSVDLTTPATEALTLLVPTGMVKVIGFSF